jgi:hypothetical protein
MRFFLTHKFGLQSKSLSALRYMQRIGMQKITFRKAQKMYRIQQTGFSTSIRSRNTNNATGKCKLPGDIIFKMNQRE